MRDLERTTDRLSLIARVLGKPSALTGKGRVTFWKRGDLLVSKWSVLVFRLTVAASFKP